MLWFLGGFLIVVWIVGLAFKMAGGFVHIVLFAGLALFILAFISGGRRTRAEQTKT